jgi:glycosyltransferase involved in cell wall biosynthesis
LSSAFESHSIPPSADQIIGREDGRMGGGERMTEGERLCIAHVDAERGFSGGELQVFLLMSGLRELGHRNVLLCPPGSLGAGEAGRLGIECHTVRMRNAFDATSILSLRRWLVRSGADLAHLHTSRATWLGGLAARAARVPAITTCRMERKFKRGWRMRFIYESLVRQVVAISPDIAASLAAAGVPKDRCRVVRSAVDPAMLAPSGAREQVRAQLGVEPDDRVLLTLAALIPRKALDVLLDALALLAEEGRRPWLWIAGDGPQRGELEAQTIRLGLQEQVCFLGRRADVGDLLAACDVFVLPSHREGLGVAALEAMAAGRPVVATAVGGLQEAVVDGRTGLLVPPADAPALADALGRLLHDDSLREGLGAAGPGRIVEGYLPEQMVAAYEEVYRSVVTQWRTRGAPA